MLHRFVPLRARTLIQVGLLTSLAAARAVSLGEWSSLVSLRPDGAVQGRLLNRVAEPEAGTWHVQKIEHSRGELLLESTGIVITKMPAFDGRVADMKALMAQVRLHFAEFFDPATSAFAPFSDDDKATWVSANPTGAVVRLTTKTAGGSKDMAFVVGESGADRVVLSSVHGGQVSVGNNPFSGNREIGVTSALPLDGCILYSHAAVRAAEAATADEEKALAAQSQALWASVFQSIKSFVERQGGTVVDGLDPQTSTLVSWNSVAKTFHQPKAPWQDMDGLWQSTDKEKRFALQFRGLGAPCEFIERNRQGKEVRVACQIQIVPAKTGSSYLIERPNDSKEVLSFYEFNPALQADIIAAKPKPSRLVITRSGDKLKADWFGLTISRDATGRLSGMKQPGEAKSRPYEFKPEGL